MSEATTAARRSELAARVGSGAAMLAVAVLAVYAGGTPFWLLVSAACIVMLIEWFGLIGASRWQLTLALVGLAVALLIFGFNPLSSRSGTVLLATLGIIAAVAAATRNVKLAAGVAYAGLPGLALLAIRSLPDTPLAQPGAATGFGLTLWTMAVVWATDIGAFFAGRGFGGLKLAPTISPSKTWSGLFGGMIAAGLIGAGLGVVLELPLITAWLGVPLAVVAQMGDLYESSLKRRAGVKDSGHILPGHGGVLDRLDGLVPVAVLVAVLLALGAL